MKIANFLFLLFPGGLLAQNWMPISPGETYHYRLHDSSYITHTLYVDSLKIPVSYTHLDVYKRQTPLAAATPTPIFSGPLSPPCGVTLPALLPTADTAATALAPAAPLDEACLLYTSRCV